MHQSAQGRSHAPISSRQVTCTNQLKAGHMHQPHCNYAHVVLPRIAGPPFSMISTRLFRWGRTAHPIRMAICWTIFIPVCLACHDFLLRHTALRKGSSDGMPSADATTANALQDRTTKLALCFQEPANKPNSPRCGVPDVLIHVVNVWSHG